MINRDDSALIAQERLAQARQLEDRNPGAANAVIRRANQKPTASERTTPEPLRADAIRRKT